MTVTYYGSPVDLRIFLRSIPAILAGHKPDPGFAEDIRLRLGVALLSQIQQDFLTKAQGGMGRDGIKWKPLSPYTIARRRKGPADKKSLTLKAKTRHLSASEKKEFMREYRKVRAKLAASGMAPDRASFQARVQVTRKYKRKGFQVQSDFEILAARQVEVLRDTGELFKSLSPGIENNPSHAPGQIFETPPGRVIVGTNKKPWHHTTSGQGRLPRRPFWPDRGIPPAWAKALLFVAQRALQRQLENMVRLGRF